MAAVGGRWLAGLVLALALLAGTGGVGAVKINAKDEKALFEIKAQAKSFLGSSTWVKGGQCQTFFGVSCTPTGRVNLLSMSRMTSSQLPKSACKLNALTFLSVSGQVSALPSCISTLHPTLKGLYLNSNKLKGPMPAFIPTLSQLTALALSGNALSGPIPLALSRLRRLQSLQLNKNAFSSSIPASIVRLPALTSL